MTRAADVAY